MRPKSPVKCESSFIDCVNNDMICETVTAWHD